MPRAPQSMRLLDSFALGSSKPWCYFSAKFHSLYYLIAHKVNGKVLYRAKVSTSALEKIEYSFPSHKGEYFGMDDEQCNRLYPDIGEGKSFMELANKHYVELEKELGNENPDKLYDSQLLCIDNDSKQ